MAANYNLQYTSGFEWHDAHIIFGEIPLIHVHNLPLAFTRVSCLVYSSTLKMEAICSHETLVDFQRLHDIVSQKILLFMLSNAFSYDVVRDARSLLHVHA
jgi:hypothetical protein